MFKGIVHKYGANVNTDDIVPARHLNLVEGKDLALHLFEDVDADFLKQFKTGDIVMADTNFGCGSSREHSPLALKAIGVSAVIAKNFARIFYRNSINIGLPLVECPECVDNTKAGDVLEVDLEKGDINNLTNGKSFKAVPYPEFMSELIAAGGLVEYTKKRIAARRA
jgi:3-isopropylmalate/(R)-2-methylmalate dehydratase small subunit